MPFYFFEPSYHKNNYLLVNHPCHTNTNDKASLSSNPFINEYSLYPYSDQYHYGNQYNKNRNNDIHKGFVHDLREALKDDPQESKNIKRGESNHSIEIPITEVFHEPHSEVKQEQNENTPKEKEQKNQYINNINTYSSIPIYLKESFPKETSTKDNTPSKETQNQKMNKNLTDYKYNEKVESIPKYPYFNHYEQSLIYCPKMDIIEDEKKYDVYVDLPGMTKEKIHMEILEDNILKISGERKSRDHTNTDKKSHYVIMERDYGHFERSFMIPSNANTDSIKAKMENCVLEIIIDKKEIQKKQARTIQIQ